MDQTFDHYSMFVSADFFVGYWPLLAGAPLSPAGVAMVQSAGRAAVSDLMGRERVYWDVDFSDERQERTLDVFSTAVGGLDESDRAAEEVMRRNFCDDPQEGDNVAFALGFLSRIAHDRVFRIEAGVRVDDGEAVAECLAALRGEVLDRQQIELDWLASTAGWDETIRALTPDLPEHASTNFHDVYRTVVVFPRFVTNLSKLPGSEDHATMLKRLGERMANQFPASSGLAVPLAMRAGE